MHGNWDWFMKERDWGNSENCGNIIKYTTYTSYLRYFKIPVFFITDIFDTPDKCTYHACRVTCTNYTDMPKNLSPSVTAMYALQKNMLRVQ